MTTRWKSFAGAAALAVGLTLLPATASAQDWGHGRHGGSRMSFSGRSGGRFRGEGRFRGGPFRGHGRVFVGPTRFGHRAFFAGPRFGQSFVGGFRPFRVVRVFVYDPFPHWIYRRIYYDPYCP